MGNTHSFFRASVPRPALVLLLLASILLGSNLLAPGDTVKAHNANWSCYPQYWGGAPPPDNHIIKFNQNTSSPSYYCANAAAWQTTQYTYWTNALTWGDPDGWVWVFMYHGNNENVQQQLDGPNCANSGTPPYCSYCGCTWKWWSYWYKYYSDGWKNQQTNTWGGGPYWHRQGWF